MQRDFVEDYVKTAIERAGGVGEVGLNGGAARQVRVYVDPARLAERRITVAEVREACGIPGTSVRTAFLCRDKPAMKEALREAGVPCAQSTGASSADEVREFAARVGYPLILKPRDSAGAAGTFRADSDEELEQAIQAAGTDRGMPTAVEEFIEGHEGFYLYLIHI